MRIAGLPFDIGWFLCGSMAFGKVLFLRRGKTWGRKSTPTSSLFTRHATERQVDATSCCSLVSPVRLCDPMDSSTPGFPVLHHFPVFAQTHIYWVDDTIQPSHPLVLNLSQHQGLFQWVGSLHQVPKYWSFSFSTSPSNEYSGLISFRMDWFGLHAVQGTLKSLLQHHSSKASIFVFQLSLWSNSHICTWLLEKPQLWQYGPLSAKWYCCFLICYLGLS